MYSRGSRQSTYPFFDRRFNRMADLCNCICGLGFHFYLSPVRRSIYHESSPRYITVSTQFGGYVYGTCVYFSHTRVIWTHKPVVALAASFLSHAQVSSAHRWSGSSDGCSWSCPLLPSQILEIPILQCETCGYSTLRSRCKMYGFAVSKLRSKQKLVRDMVTSSC